MGSSSCSCICGVVTCIVVTVVIIVSAPIALRCTAPDYGDAQEYAGTDTHIIPVINTVFCEGLKVYPTKFDYLLSYYNISLMILNSPPKLTGHDMFSFSDSFSFSRRPYWVDGGDYYHYRFYMYPGSNVTVSACISNGEADSSSTLSTKVTQMTNRMNI